MDNLGYYDKYKYVFVLGNGFDLDFGLATKYCNFVDSKEWEDMYSQYRDNKNATLLHYLYGKRYIEKWFDLESALLEYVSRKPDGTFVNNAEFDKECYQRVCEALVKYISNLFRNNSIKDKESPARRLLASICNEVTTGCKTYTFNFTPLEILENIASETIIVNDIGNPLHGCIPKNSILENTLANVSIILGIETESISDIAPGYTFLLKSNHPIYKSSSIVPDLINSQKVVIFGHSMNGMDYGYFEDYFKMLMENTNPHRQLIFIDKDNDSRLAILDSLRKRGVSVLKMYAHTKVDFILTSNIQDLNSEDSKLFEGLLQDIPIF